MFHNCTDQSNIDIQSHHYSHCCLIMMFPPSSKHKLRNELASAAHQMHMKHNPECLH
ncbi:hypothetical protein C0J52_00426 [Blattella germanica]|nr:hypothetical protein C0J52_00426 [Blattella germanica]